MAETLDLDDVLYRVEGYILKKFYHLPQYQLEEMVQEANILAWKKHLDGKSIKEICVAAKFRVIALLREDNRTLFTGQPSVHGGRNYEENSGKETRAKIREYIESYTRLHDHRPSQTEIAKHLGITRPSVAEHMKRLWMFSGPTEFHQESLDKNFDSGDDEQYSVTETMKFGYSFENDLIARLDTHAVMRKTLEPRERLWMYHAVFEGYEYKQIADRYGYSRSMVAHVLRQARNKLKEAVV